MLYPDAGHAFLFQEGTPFTALIESFLGGAQNSPAPQRRPLQLADVGDAHHGRAGLVGGG